MSQMRAGSLSSMDMVAKRRSNIRQQHHNVSDQILQIAKFNAEYSVPVIIQILLDIENMLKEELDLSHVTGDKFNEKRLVTTLAELAKAIPYFADIDKHLNEWKIQTILYLKNVTKEKLISDLDDLMMSMSKALWQELSTWLEGIYQLTALKIAATPNEKFVDAGDKMLWQLVGVTKFQLSGYYHDGSERVNSKIRDMFNPVRYAQSLSQLDNVIQQALLAAPKTRHGMFAGQAGAPLREVNSILSSMKDDQYDQATGLCRIAEIAVSIGGSHHPIAISAKQCLKFVGQPAHSPAINIRK